jgi:hypothetical protein
MTTHSGVAFPQWAQGGVKYPEGQGRFGVVHFHINVETVLASLGAAINPSTPDKLDIWNIPIGCQITGALLRVVTAATTTAAGGSATMGVGDEDNESGYIAAATDLKTAGYTGTVVGDTFGAATKVYSAVKKLRLTFGGTATALLTGIFDLFLFCHFADVPQAEPTAWT